MAEKAIDWLHRVRAEKPSAPWFMYFSTGCSHSPHHVPREWMDKYKGNFDEGWDVMRERTLARQKELGVVPADTELPENDEFPAWDSLSETERRLYALQMEAYAGYSENADWNVGRLLASIEGMGELDDTLVIWIWGDNGASMEARSAAATTRRRR
jgi:arylsulfatase A-like enzyme